MSPNPQYFLTHLQTLGYHPRSDKHSNSLAEAIVHDLFVHCPAIHQRASIGDLVYDINFTVRAAGADWNVDLVIGVPQLDFHPPQSITEMLRATPSTVQIAIEIKSVMTEHHKAIRNRKRDLEAHHEHVHRYSSQAIAGGVLVVNAAPTFCSPLRGADVVTTHRDPDALVRLCIDQMRAVSERRTITEYGLDAKAVIVVDMDNQDLPATRYVTKSPAPTVGDPLHYDAFIQTVCALYTEQF